MRDPQQLAAPATASAAPDKAAVAAGPKPLKPQLAGASTSTTTVGHDVPATLAAMAAAVQRAEFAEAEALGNAASVPLGVPKVCLQMGPPLSEGAQAAVYRALYTPPPSFNDGASVGAAADSTAIPVAVKKPRIRETADLERFRREVSLLASLAHPGLVRLLGARMLPPDYSAVLELEATNAASELHGAGWRPSWGCAAALGAQAAAALAHMHAHGVVHRDIKPANLLLDETRTRARLADLGIALQLGEAGTSSFSPSPSPPSAVDDGSSAASGSGSRSGAGSRRPASSKPSGGFHRVHVAGTLEYMSPEVLLGAGASCASDVYALGVTLAELGTGVFPFSDCTRDNPLAHTVLEMGYGRQELAAAVAAEGLRPTLPPSIPTPMRTLLEACWAREPAERPSAQQLAEQLQALADELCTVPALPSPQPAQALAASPSLASLSSEASWPSAGESESSSDDEMQEATPLLPTQPSSAQEQHVQRQPPAAPKGRWGGEVPPAWLEAALAAAPLGASAPAVGVFASAGARGSDRMEDRHLLLRGLGGWEGVTLLAVFDGHRGAEAADYLAAHVEGHLAARWHSARSAGELLAGALADADEAFRAQQDAAWAARVAAMGPEAAGRRSFPGSTAALVLLAGGLLAVANLGDSRAVLCRAGQALPLTQDQTADREDERRRILGVGGKLQHVMGGWRVGAAGMQVTRSVGDADLKADGVTAAAEVLELPLHPSQDAFLVLATDGVWDRLGNGDAVGLVLDTVKQPDMCAKRLVTEALARGSHDNLTAAVAVLPGGGAGATSERVFVSDAAAGAAGQQLRRQVEGGRRGRGALGALAADELAETY